MRKLRRLRITRGVIQRDINYSYIKQNIYERKKITWVEINSIWIGDSWSTNAKVYRVVIFKMPGDDDSDENERDRQGDRSSAWQASKGKGKGKERERERERETRTNGREALWTAVSSSSTTCTQFGCACETFHEKKGIVTGKARPSMTWSFWGPFPSISKTCELFRSITSFN